MAKWVKYSFCCGADEGSEQLIEKQLSYSEEAIEIAKKESYNGEYTVEEDDTPSIPTTSERLLALENAMLELLGVTMND